MPLSVGTRLGPYEILAPLGAGGMGEVYRASDTRLKRDVALKVLPEALARDPERIARFQREAEVLASLNHPNIAAIYGVEHDGDKHALAMELVEGESPKGPVPFDEAWKIASQIADALEYAHDKGVVHRDLKPANVKVTLEGTVKLLDFGLAKAFTAQREVPATMAENSPTLTIGATEVGVILGTAAYMAPEQARGKQVDKRADIWAFGVVFYELLTGERLFKGEDATETLAHVVTAHVDLSKVQVQARGLIESCLQRDPKLRLKDIGAAKAIIKAGEQLWSRDQQERMDAGALRNDQASSRSRWSRLYPVAWIAAGVAIAVAAGVPVIAYRATRPASLKPLVRLDLDLGAEVSRGSLGTHAILSPDGSRLVYVANNQLYTRRLDQSEPVEFPDTVGAFAPFFSPDGQWVAFFGGGKLQKVSVNGGAPVVLCNAPIGLGGSWGEDGSIVAQLTLAGGLSRIPASGGAPAPLAELNRGRGEVSQRWPQILPRGKALLFIAHTRTVGGFDDASIEVMSPESRKTVNVARGPYARYVAAPNGTGYILYVNRGTLFAVRFDAGTLEVRGTPTPVLSNVAYDTNNGSAEFEVLESGTLIYRSGDVGSGLTSVQWLNGDGKTRPLLPKPGNYGRPNLSPDGQRLALEIREGAGQDIWIYDIGRDTMSRITFDARGSQNPIWSPDGRFVIYGDQGGLFWTRADGAGKPQLLTATKSIVFPWSFSPDGRRVAYMELGVESAYGLWTAPVESDSSVLKAGKPEPFVRTAADERYPTFSPDGQWLAYSSNESGIFQIYVRAFPDRGGKWQISSAGGAYPMWSRRGHDLFFESLESRIMVAGYTIHGDTFLADKPRKWSETVLATTVTSSKNVDLAPDGKRILAFVPVDEPGVKQSLSHVIFLENFLDELQRKVPAK